MSRQGVCAIRLCLLRPPMLLGLAALALCLAACLPAVPPVVTALPPLTLTAAPLTPVTSTPPSPVSTALPTPTATLGGSETPAASITTSTQHAPPAASATTSPAATMPATDPATAVLPPPTPDALAAARHVRLPILMYHYVEPWPANASSLRKRLTVQPQDFGAQMAYLHSQGYVTVSLYELMAALALGRPLPSRAVVLTFDDGYRTLVDYAAPVLKPLGYTGTIFVITQLMDENFAQYMTWPQAEALYAAGWKIEPHTKTHASLAGRARDYQLYEMLGSVQTVQAHIGTAPRFLAYPYGKWDAVTIELAREMNLWAAVTEIPGAVHDYADRYTLHRVRINGTITLADFIRTIKATQ